MTSLERERDPRTTEARLRLYFDSQTPKELVASSQGGGRSFKTSSPWLRLIRQTGWVGF